MHNLFRNMTILSQTTAIASSTATNSGTITDVLGYGGVAFVYQFDSFTTACQAHCHAEGGSASASSDMADIEDSAVSADSVAASTASAGNGAIVVLDIGRPKYRYYRPVVAYVADTAGAVVNRQLVLGYNPVQAAVAHSTSVITGAVYLYSETTGASTGS